MTQDIDSKRREWAEREITKLRRMREHIDEQMRSFETFLRMLDVSRAMLKNGGAAQMEVEVPDSDLPLGEMIARALKEAGVPLSPRQVAERIQKGGYSYPGRLPFAAVVSAELNRQFKTHRRGIVKTGPGKYTVAA